MTPVVSVCIANYNGIGLIDACIASVRAQELPFPIEIIVHDDASDDGSCAHIRAHHPDVTLIASEHNVGFCVANNRMAERAAGTYLLLLNNDAELMGGALIALHTTALSIVKPAILTLPQYDHDSGELIDRGCLLDPFFNPVPNLDPERRDVAMVIGACLWIPRALWLELEGFPDWFESIGEDLYLCCRARLAGYPVQVAGESGYVHRVGRSFGGGRVRAGRLSTTYRRRALSERNKTFAMVATCPAPAFQILFPLHILVLVIEGFVLTVLRRHGGLWTRVYLASLRDLRHASQHLRQLRRRVQRCRRTSITGFCSAFDWRPYKLRMLLRHGLPTVQ